MRLTVHEFTSLDGVVQGPGGPDEDRDGGFELGGWTVPYGDEGFGEIVGGWFDKTGAVLLGRRTFEMFRGFWPQVTDPDDQVARVLRTVPKYVASRTLADPGWDGTTVLSEDVLQRVAELKASDADGELQVHGSCSLVHQLHAAGLVDEYRLIAFPVYLGQGKRLFPSGAPAGAFTLLSSRTTPAGGVYSELAAAEWKGVGEYVVQDGREVTR